MQIELNSKIASDYENNSQKIRVMTEDWIKKEVFCPSCGSNLNRFANNRPVADFFCPKCSEEYESKGKSGSVGKRILDGAYKTMLDRLQSNNNPSLFILSYNPVNYLVTNFFVIPKHFFVQEIIEKRKPLADTARRSGWVGCNILLSTIPQSGKIYYIKDSKIEAESKIFDSWQKTLFLREQKEPLAKGWILDVMNCIDRLGKRDFKLDEIYAFQDELAKKHPSNKHIKDKIRQQLQLLRDKGYLTFVSRGMYRVN